MSCTMRDCRFARSSAISPLGALVAAALVPFWLMALVACAIVPDIKTPRDTAP